MVANMVFLLNVCFRSRFMCSATSWMCLTLVFVFSAYIVFFFIQFKMKTQLVTFHFNLSWCSDKKLAKEIYLFSNFGVLDNFYGSFVLIGSRHISLAWKYADNLLVWGEIPEYLDFWILSVWLNHFTSKRARQVDMLIYFLVGIDVDQLFFYLFSS